MKIEWVHASEEHLREIGDVLYQGLGNDYVSEVVGDQTLLKYLDTHARTMLADGKSIMTVGVWPQWQGVVNVWLFTTPEIYNHRIAVIRQIRRFMKQLVERDHVHRLQAWVHAQHYEGQKFVEHFGFVCEGVMRQFTQDKKDMLLYARIIQ